MLDELRKIEEFKELPEEDLQWILDKGELNEYKNGDYIFSKGDPIDKLQIILEGQFEIKIEQNGQFRSIASAKAPTITGLLPYSRATHAAGFGMSEGNARVLTVHGDHFPEMIKERHELTRALVHIMSSRIRSFTKAQQQNDKMMALGKLSAGLAHELNNPSAAVVRSSESLKKHLAFLPEKFKSVISIKMSNESIDAVNDLLFERAQNKNRKLSLMQKSELEDDLVDWLEDHGVENPFELAENLAEFEFKPDELELIAEKTTDQHLLPVLDWVNQILTTEKLVTEIEEASSRINELVNSVKTYTHMDQAPEKQLVDISDGIESTLTMLNHKIKKGNINIEREYQENLPKAKVFISELNQVWTNLIDNAIDAMEESNEKKLSIKLQKDGQNVLAQIGDSGMGIPEEIKESIFDPFFTTKSVGKGTGLGLDVVQQIVNQHLGRIGVESQPGNTVFSIHLPLEEA